MSSRAPVVVVGGGPAGFSVVSEYRRRGGTLPVVMLCAESLPPYQRPPLTKEFLRGDTTLTELLMEGAGWYRANDIDVRLGTTAAALHPDARILVTDAADEIAYEECVLCTGSEPVRPSIPGADAPGVQVIRTVRDSTELAAAGTGRRVAVVGSGFIGCEAAVSLAMRGASVSVITPEEAPQSERLGPEVAQRLAAWLREAGVELLPGRSLTAIEEEPGGLRLSLDEGGMTCDRVLLAVGVRPRIDLAREAGVPTEDGAIWGAPVASVGRVT